MIIPVGGGRDDAGRPGRPHRPRRQRSSIEALRKVLDDPGYLAFKEELGERLTPGEKSRLEAARAAGARPRAAGAQPEGGEP